MVNYVRACARIAKIMMPIHNKVIMQFIRWLINQGHINLVQYSTPPSLIAMYDLMPRLSHC